ncbi:MAG: hypothetical protein ABIP93_01150 [Gemmatimonadaceae bacterium]
MTAIHRIALYAALAGVTLTHAAAAQARSAASASRPLPLLTAMSAAEQTRLALSTAPEEVASGASIYVLTAKGYTRTRAGRNGFSCLVERELLETVEPICYDAEGSATTLKARVYREELRAKGVAEASVKTAIATAYRAGRLKAPRKPGIIYMLARENYAWNDIAKKLWTHPPHYMFHAPFATQGTMGGPLGPTTPIVGWPGQPDAVIIVMAATH